MKKLFSSILFSLYLSILTISAFAIDNNNYTFHRLSPRGGYYYDGVKKITQDKDGFIWIMMDYELFRFDGYEYKRYYSLFSEWNKSANWSFNTMLVDSDGKLYVATNDGLYVYSKETDSFELLIDEIITSITTDAKNNLWVRAKSNWGIYDKKDKNITFPLFEGKKLNIIRHLLPSNGQELYMISNYGKIFRYDYNKKEIIQNNIQKSELENIGFLTDAKLDRGKLWMVVGQTTLVKADLSTLRIEERYDNFLSENGRIRSIHIDENGSIWIGTFDGLYIFDQSSKKFSYYQYLQSNKSLLPNSSIWTIYEDMKGNIWLGTYAGGLYYVDRNHNSPFSTYSSQPYQLNHQTVSSFAEDRDYIWIGTEGGGINRLNKHTNSFQYFTHDKQKNSLSFNNVKSLVLDNYDNLWIGTFNGGIDRLNTKTGIFTNFTQKAGSKELLYSSNVRKIVEEENSGIWIAYQHPSTVISFLDKNGQNIKHYNICPSDSNSYIFDMLRDKNNNLWALTRQKILKMNVNTYKTEEIVLSDSLVLNGQTFCIDNSGKLWIGTIGRGLMEYNPEDASYKVHSKILDYNISSIFALYYDSDKKLWIGTDNGLFRYDIVNDEYLRFDEYDGTQGNVYYPLSAYKGKDGRLFFGGTNGFTIIDDRKLSINRTEAKVFISEFFLDNKPMKSINNYLSEDGEIVLDHDQANFAFKFSSDNYLMPQKNKFKYRLVGYDDKWLYTDATNRVAAYAKIPSGKYTLEIYVANNDGIWSTTPTSINIIRKPAPWLSWPAYLLYSIMAIAVIYIAYRYYTEKKNLKLQLYLDGIEKNKREELHQSQLRFFTNISHDFRTPLSLILGVVDKLREEGLKEYYYRILNNNAQSLLTLVNELMDFRSIENNKMKLEVEKTDANAQVDKIASNFVDYAKQHDIRYEIELDRSLSKNTYIDRYLLEKILMNLLNNAFKYTKSKGFISIKTFASCNQFESTYDSSYTIGEKEKGRDYFSIVIRDSGVGISKESISKVFERFYKVQTNDIDSHLGTGIGLALVKSMTILHKGTISIYSLRDKGTDFVVCFPIGRDAYSDNEFKIVDDQQELKQTQNMEDTEDGSYLLPDEDSEGFVKDSRNKILLVEDNADLRKLIADSLIDTYDVIEAEDGVVASELLNKFEIDLILSDIMMPRKDGIEFCSEVKGDIDTSHIPFIILSAKTTVESKIEGADSGADIYFEKPIDFQLLKITIGNVFKQRDILREHYAKNYYAESSELTISEKDNTFLKDFIAIIDKNIDKSDMDVNTIALEMSMSRSKLYKKVKGITGKSIVEFILNYRLRKAARLIIEEDLTMREVMIHIGIESQPYFTNAFKKEFGKTPTQFAAEYKNKGLSDS